MRKLVTLGALLVLAIALAGAIEFAPRGAGASSHREAPLISQDPAADNTDTYFFRSPDDPNTVTMIMNVYPYQGPAGGPNFYRFGDDVRYEFNIDNNGDAKADIRYMFKFTTTIKNDNTFLYNSAPITAQAANVLQTYNLYKVSGGNVQTLLQGRATPPSFVGCHSFLSDWSPTIPAFDCSDTNWANGNYELIANSVIYDVPGGGKVWAGQRRDSFFGDVGAIFDLLSIRGGFDSGGYNTFENVGVQTIALQLPISELKKGSEPVIGMWASTSRRPTRVLPGVTAKKPEKDQGINSPNWKQVSRLGLALINEAVIPMATKDMFNSTKPKDDAANYAAYVVDPELANLLNALYGVSIPPTPRNDLVENLLLGIDGLNRPANAVPGDLLRLNTDTPICDSGCSPLGAIAGDVQGYPNGRRLTDDVIDISERVIAGVLVGGFNISPNNILGDGVNSPAGSISDTFPYLATPVDGFNYNPQ